jgi:hypothetical protein
MDKIPTYKVSIEPEEEGQEERLGWDLTAFTETPAIITKGIAFNSHKPLHFKDEMKMRVAAPVMIPDVEIYRLDEDTNEEYNVVFDAETIESIHSKFMQNMENKGLFNLEHDSKKKVPAYFLELWIVDNPEKDKSFSTYGVKVPKGTLFAVAQVTDKEYFNSLVENDQLGFSIEAILNLKLSKFKKQNKMNLPDGKFTDAEGKVFEVKDGVATLLAAEETAEESDENMNEETSEEEVNNMEEGSEESDENMEETDEESEENMEDKSEESEEEMMVDPEADTEAIMAVVQPMFDAFKEEVLNILADKLPNEETEESEESEEDMSETPEKLSMHDKLEKVRNYKPKK